MTIRGNMKALAFAAALAAGALVAPVASADPLRVCADPDNLPFSKSEGPERGMYVELAELVGKQLNQPVEYTWYYTQMQRRALRNTILQDACDAVFALPAGPDYKARGLRKTQAFIDVGYAIVAAQGFSFTSLDDLKSKRLAVQYGSTPQIFLSTLDGFQTTTFRSADEALTALSKGEVDAAFIWGPVAGYENKKRWDNRWRVTPVAGNNLSGAVAVAVRSTKEALAADIDRALVALKPQIAELADKYGFPRQPPVNLAVARASLPVTVVRVPSSLWTPVSEQTAPAKKGSKAAPKAAAAAAPVAVATAAPALSESAQAGRVQFNDRCSHCHGSDGYSPVRERDVRFLKMRYNEKWQDTAVATIKNGRPDAGMPTWKDILKESDVQQIVSFLVSIQK
ncbi:MAG: transporter substrate-binding domain-containing protein [Burkholderiaceae bacterium]